MMYTDKMAFAVKANGRVLRENKDTVFLPFGCEYSLMIKNLNSVRALVKVWIDGQDVTEGTTGLVVHPNSSIDLERFIKEGNMSSGNKFKFIERTKQISNHRGNKIDDGLIRFEFEFERPPAVIQPIYRPVIDYYVDPYYPRYPYHGPYFLGSVGRGMSIGGSAGASAGLSNTVTDFDGDTGQIKASLASGTAQLNNVSYSANATADSFAVPQNATKSLRSRSKSIDADVNEKGITVAGSESSQQFYTVSSFPMDGVKHAAVLHMLGEVEGQVVEAPVTVKHKPTCTSCGKVNKANSKFCAECGTALQLF